MSSFNNVLICLQKKPLKTKVNQLLRRASTNSFMPDRKHANGHLPQESKVRWCWWIIKVSSSSYHLLLGLWKLTNARRLTSTPCRDDFVLIPQQDGDFGKKSVSKKNSIRRWSEVTYKESATFDQIILSSSNSIFLYNSKCWNEGGVTLNGFSDDAVFDVSLSTGDRLGWQHWRWGGWGRRGSAARWGRQQWLQDS